MIEAHTRTSQALVQAAMKAGLSAPPKGLGGDQQKLLAALQSERGANFDRTYVKQQKLAHEEALIVEQAYTTKGSNPELRAAAQAALAAMPLSDQVRNFRSTP